MSLPRAGPPDFDRLARPYRWLEYLSFGNALERTRFYFLDRGACDRCRSALVLGDGDGRFTARLMARNRTVRVVAVDASRAMLALLEARCALSADRLTLQHDDVRTAALGPAPVARGAVAPASVSPGAVAPGADLVVTHFLLDCLTAHETRLLVERVTASLAPGALWLVSEFRAPVWWSRLLVRALYVAFRVLTGLRVTTLPPHARVLEGCGFRQIEESTRLGGLLAAELWQWLPEGANIEQNGQPAENL